MLLIFVLIVSWWLGLFKVLWINVWGIVFFLHFSEADCLAVALLQVKVLYARNLTQDCTEDALKQAFEIHGKIERVKKIKDYAFIHFEERDHALKVSFPALADILLTTLELEIESLNQACSPNPFRPDEC